MKIRSVPRKILVRFPNSFEFGREANDRCSQESMIQSIFQRRPGGCASQAKGCTFRGQRAFFGVLRHVLVRHRDIIQWRWMIEQAVEGVAGGNSSASFCIIACVNINACSWFAENLKCYQQKGFQELMMLCLWNIELKTLSNTRVSKETSQAILVCKLACATL